MLLLLKQWLLLALKGLEDHTEVVALPWLPLRARGGVSDGEELDQGCGDGRV